MRGDKVHHRSSGTGPFVLVTILLATLFGMSSTLAQDTENHEDRANGFSLGLPVTWWYKDKLQEPYLATFGSPDGEMSGAVTRQVASGDPRDSVAAMLSFWNSVTHGGAKSEMSSEISNLPATVLAFPVKLQDGKPGETVVFVVASKSETWTLSLVGPRKGSRLKDGLELLYLQRIADSFRFSESVLERIRPTAWSPGLEGATTRAAAHNAVPSSESPGGMERAGSSERRQPSSEPSKTIRVGGDVMRAKLVSDVEPAYPAFARLAGIQGTVRLEVTVRPDGFVDDIKVVSGHPLLVGSALKAVSKWSYRPTLLNGGPVAVVTEVDAKFALSEK